MDRRGLDCMVVRYTFEQFPMLLVPITTNVVSSHPTQTSCTRYIVMSYSLSITSDRSVFFSPGTPVSFTNQTDHHIHDIPVTKMC